MVFLRQYQDSVLKQTATTPFTSLQFVIHWLSQHSALYTCSQYCVHKSLCSELNWFDYIHARVEGCHSDSLGWGTVKKWTPVRASGNGSLEKPISGTPLGGWGVIGGAK